MGDPVTAFIAKVIVAITTPTAVGVAAGISKTFIVVSKIAATVAAMAAASAYAKGQMPKMGDSADLKRDVNIRGGTEARTIVYGEALVGGVIAYSNVGGPDKRELTTVIVHAGHEVHDMTDVFLDAARITNAQIGSGAGAGTGFQQVTSGDYFVGAPTNTGYAGVDRRKGSPTQSSNALLISQFGTDFDSADRGRNVAYSVFQLALVEPSQKMFEGGVRDYKTLIQGKLVYNPAADTSAGADMIANGFASTTYKSYSTNPILCAIDYLMDNRLGMAVKPSNINWDEVVSEAAYCDRPVATSVTGERDTRFSCNGALSTYDTYKTNISRIISSCNGSIAYKNGKWFLKAGRYGQGYSGVANGAFSSNASWAKFGTGTAAETGGRMECISTAGNKVGRYQQLNGLVVGTRYVVTGLFEDAVIGAASKAEMNVTTGAADTGTVVGGASIATTGGTPNILDGNQEFEFIATATTLFLNVLATGTSTVYFDNIEAYVVAEVTLNEDWLRDSVGIQTGLTKQERFNGTRAFYFSAAESFKQIQSLEVTNTINLARDNQESLFRELSLPMTNSEDRAQRIQYKLLKMNERQVRISVACNYLALNVAVHDRLMVTIGELNFDQKPFLVETWELMDSQGGVNMTLIEDDADYWRDPDTNDYSTRTDTGVVIPATPEVPPPTNVTLTSRVGLPDLTISWTDPEPSQQYDYAQVYRATSNNFGAAVVLVDLRGNTYTDTQAAAGQNYYYWVRSRKGREFSTEVATTPTNATGAAINAATATNVQWSGVLDGAGTIPSNNATVGGSLGLDIKDDAGNVVEDYEALNQYAIGALQAENFNPFFTIVDPDRETPSGWYLGNQTNNVARSSIIEYTSAAKTAIRMKSGYGATLVSQAMKLKWGYETQASVTWRTPLSPSYGVFVKFIFWMYDGESLGTNKLAVCLNPSNGAPNNADPEVITATRNVRDVLKQGTSNWQTETFEFGSLEIFAGNDITVSYPQGRWLSFGVVVDDPTGRDIDVEIDTVVIYHNSKNLIGFGVP